MLRHVDELLDRTNETATNEAVVNAPLEVEEIDEDDVGDEAPNFILPAVRRSIRLKDRVAPFAESC